MQMRIVWALAACFIVQIAVAYPGGPLTAPASQPSGDPVMLPQTHEYQRQLHKYLSTLKEEDFVVERKLFVVPPGDPTMEDQLKARILWEQPSQPPAFGPAIIQPASCFTLASIESPEGVKIPRIFVDALSWVATWNSPINPYYNSRPLKLRAFVIGAVDMMMHDAAHERPDKSIMRSDYMGGTLIWLAYAYRAARDVVPPEAAAAYAEGLKKVVRRINDWGPTGAMTDMDLFAAVSMRMVSDLVKDPETTRIAEAYIKRLYTDTRYYHPAGYFVDHGCFDTSYNGISLYFTMFAALYSRDLTYLRDALDQSFKLKSRLMFPEPGGATYGPSQCSSRTSDDSGRDQWNWPVRNWGASMLTDNAMFLTKLPPPKQLTSSTQLLVSRLNTYIDANVTKPVEANAWFEWHWSRNLNPPFEYYVEGYAARRAALEEANSPLLKNPYLRGEDFIEDYAKAFLIARIGDYAAAIHTGPVGHGIFGWGGGQLCAFWTEKTGAVLLGRRRGYARQTHHPETSESFDFWRISPIHAVSGITTDGQVFTSAKIRDPKPVYNITGKQRAEVRVEGLIPKDPTNSAKPCLTGDVQYGRTFVVDESGVTVTTSIKSDGKDQATELYETLPIFFGEGFTPEAKAKALALVKIDFQIGGEWKDATPDPQDAVTAVRITRHGGAILIAFAKPVRARLSPEVWADFYQSRAMCRNVMVDLLGGNGEPRAIPETSISYKITAVKK